MKKYDCKPLSLKKVVKERIEKFIIKTRYDKDDDEELAVIIDPCAFFPGMKEGGRGDCVALVEAEALVKLLRDRQPKRKPGKKR